MDYQDQEEYIGYKIDTRHSYKIYCNLSGGKKYYKVQVQKKNYDGTKINYYKQLRFAKCTPPEDGEIIRIKKAFEDLYTNNIDKFNPISVIVVLEYEKVENQQVQQEQALAKFQDTLKEDEWDAELPF